MIILMVNKMGKGFMEIVYNNMLVFGFGQPIGKVREWHHRRMNKEFAIPNNFMQMSIWEEMTEEQFNTLVTLLDADLIESFIIVACYYNMAITKRKDRKRRSSEEFKEQDRIRSRIYREKNRDEIRKKQRERYHKNKDKNRDKNNKRSKEYYRKNKEALLIKSKEYYEKNKDEILKKQRERYHKNKEK
jgi:hypothetical protein|tara:strand:+ start:227 stop:790 length:564 start_codon:yes stop_codon:yes gene_type:complete